MTFTEFVKEILNTFVSENPEQAEIYEKQIKAIIAFRNEINGYGAYSHFTLQPGSPRFTGEGANQYGNNSNFIIMEGRDRELGFVLAITDGLIDFLEIYPNDGENWDGQIMPFHFSKSPCA